METIQCLQFFLVTFVSGLAWIKGRPCSRSALPRERGNRPSGQQLKEIGQIRGRGLSKLDENGARGMEGVRIQGKGWLEARDLEGIAAFTSKRTNLSPFTKGCRDRDASMRMIPIFSGPLAQQLK